MSGALSACGGGAGNNDDNEAPAEPTFHVVTMVDGWASRVPENALQTRNDDIARYDQIERATRAQVEQFVKDIGLAELGSEIDEVLCAVNIASWGPRALGNRLPGTRPGPLAPCSCPTLSGFACIWIAESENHSQHERESEDK